MLPQTAGSLPPPGSAPAIAQVVGAPGVTSAGPSDVLAGFQAQRRELNNQLEQLERRRQELMAEVRATPSDASGRAGLDARIKDFDQRISTVDQQLAQADAAVARASAVPGAVVPPPQIIRRGPPEEAFVLGGMFMVLVLFPLSIGLMRRWWRRGNVQPAAFPPELGERFTRLEQAVDAIAVEVERVGETQRFVAQQFANGSAPRALGAGGAEPIAVPLREAQHVERR